MQTNIQVKALFLDTVRKEVRNKSLIFALIFSTLSILLVYSIMKVAFSKLGGSVSIGSNTGAPMIVSSMFSFLNFWAAIISVFFGVSAMRSDFQSNIIYQYLSFPISRTTYMVTRLLGTWFIVFSFYLYSYLLTIILFMSVDKSMAPTLGQLGSILLMAVYTLSYVGIAFIVSFNLNRLSSFLLMLSIWSLISITNGYFVGIPLNESFNDFNILKALGFPIYWLFPHLGNIQSLASSLLFATKSELNWYIEIPHFLVSMLGVAYLGKYLIQKKDF
jgi:ABC-type transport system involved in multi-copper enzyme maturation permease subunit